MLRFVARGLLFLVAFLLLLVVAGLGALQTGWAKNLIRGVIVRQANQYLTAQLEIGRLGGSILRGVQLGDITLSRDGHPIVLIDDLSLTYSIRELFERGTVIRAIRLVRPRVFIARQPDGRWDIAALVKRETRESERTGPSRPIHILSIEVMDGTVSLADPLDFGAAHVSTQFNSLNASLSFDYEPVKWRLMFANAAWTGLAPDLTVSRLKGGLGRGPGGWTFDDLFVETPRTTFTLSGRANNDAKPTQLDLQVRAPRFAFQEWAGVLRGLKNIAVEASFETQLKGPLAHLDTTLRFGGTGGSVTGALVLDTTVPGWHGSGALDVDRVNLARWLNRPDRPSDFSGRVTFDLALELGQHFPRGTYGFAGPHAAFMEYAADDVRARGQITSREVLIAGATAAAYGANVAVTSGSIGIDEPFPFRFAGTTTNTDLRRVPASVPVPHVDSLLAFAYDVSGRFSQPFIAGRAEFARSVFLGATVGPGSVGTIDTSADPLTFGGTGEIDGVNVGRFGEGLGVAWMQEPRYAGTVSGRFNVKGAGTDRAQLTLTGGGRLARANLFGGSLSDADVTIDIDRGTLRASFNGRVQGIDPSIPLADPRFAASVSGSADVRTTVRDLLIRTPEVSDYDIEGSINAEASEVRGLHVDQGRIDGRFHDGIATLTRVDLTGPGIEGHGTGTVAFVDGQPSDFQYDIVSADLAQLQPTIGDVTGLSVTGLVSTKGRLTGPWSAIRFAGDGSIGHLAAPRVDALTANGSYDVTVPSWQIAHVAGRATGEASFLNVFGQAVQQAAGTVTLAEKRLGVDVQITQKEGRAGALKGTGVIHDDGRGVDLAELTVTLGRAPWRLAPGDPPPTVAWSNEGLAVSPLLFLGGTAGDERIAVSGTVRSDGQGALRVTATHMFLDTIEGAFERPASYGGVVDFDATIRGTVEEPIVKARVTIAEGRVQRFSYQSLAGRVDYAGQMFDVDLRLDQSPGVWMNAAGTVPLAMFNRELAERPINLAVTSSSIGLGLIEGITSVVRNVTGELRVNATVVGTSRDPHFQGDVSLANAAFLVVSTGVRYKNGKAALTLATDRIGVDALHIEDSSGRPLDVHGSLGTHEMTVGDLEIDAEAKGFEIVRNEFGRMAVDLMLKLRGRLEMPRIGGTITVASGDLKVDEILTRTLFQPYSTEAISPTVVDAVVALNPWDRLGLDISLHVPTQMRLTGEDVQVSPDTPVGLGNISLRVGGDLYLYKDPGEPISVTGSLDRVAGTYTFQGRRFDINEASSSINFHGDLNPDVYVTVTRLISGVLTRVTIAGELNNPALQLASTPPLDESDILSLIVFNTSTNQLSSSQQQELALRGATLAAGFFATPLLSALENELGLDTLEIEPVGDFGTGPKVTVGEEIAPGLIARFSRQFGSDAYDEASIEYYLSRIIRLRATFSDASATSTRVAFYRVERSGVDLLFFFSF